MWSWVGLDRSPEPRLPLPFSGRVRLKHPDALLVYEDCQDTHAVLRVGRALIAIDRERLVKEGGSRTAAGLIRDLQDIANG